MNKKYKIVLIDADDTILDFKKCERNAITKTIENFNIKATEELILRYSEINKSLWKAFERKEITKPELLKTRFEIFFSKLGIEIDPSEVNTMYLDFLSNEAFLLDGAKELLEVLKDNCKVYLVTNAVYKVQMSRLSKLDLIKYFDKIFISEVVGYQKPDVRFFEEVYKEISSPNKDDIIVLGDSLTSDILGGNNFNVATCYYNPHHKISDNNINPTYEIDKLGDFLKYIL